MKELNGQDGIEVRCEWSAAQWERYLSKIDVPLREVLVSSDYEWSLLLGKAEKTYWEAVEDTDSLDTYSNFIAD